MGKTLTKNCVSPSAENDERPRRRSEVNNNPLYGSMHIEKRVKSSIREAQLKASIDAQKTQKIKMELVSTACHKLFVCHAESKALFRASFKDRGS